MCLFKKTTIILVALFLLVGVFVVSGGIIQAAETDDEPLQVAAISGYFAQGLGLTIVNGLDRAEEDFNVEVRLIDTGVRALDFEEQFERVAETEDYDLIFVMGWELVDALEQTAERYPDQKFIFIDGILEDIDNENMLYINFMENEGGFLAGALASLMTTSSEAEHTNPDRARIGFVGGRDIPVINNFRVGYEQGAKYVNENVEVTSVFAGTFDDPGRGLEMARSLYDAGNDIVFNVAGPTGEGVIQGAAMSRKYAIGVDICQCGDAPGFVAGSVLKNVDVSVYNVIEDTLNGEYTPGAHNYGLVEEGVGFCECENIQDTVPEHVWEEFQEIQQAVLDGEIEIESIM